MVFAFLVVGTEIFKHQTGTTPAQLQPSRQVDTGYFPKFIKQDDAFFETASTKPFNDDATTFGKGDVVI